MACCICNRAGHDEELHGEEGEELLKLRPVASAAGDVIELLATVPQRVSPELTRKLRKLENALVEAGVRESSLSEGEPR